MKTYLIAYAGSLLSFLAIDAIWLGVIARTFYRDQLGALMSPQPSLGIAAIFYLFFAAAIVILAVLPGIRSGSLPTAAFYGAVLGLAAYGTYDITNLSTLRGWPAALSMVDMAWGTVLTAVASTVGMIAVRWLGDAA